MGFQLDQHSEAHLVGVHPDLVKVVHDCAANYPDGSHFGVTQGLRTLAEQMADVKAGKSQTMKSRHLDGHAADLVPLIMVSGQLTLSWAWPPFFALAKEMKASSLRTGVPLNWGGCWDKLLSEISDDMELESMLYVQRERHAGGKGFLDGPHFQLPWAEYPSTSPAAA